MPAIRIQEGASHRFDDIYRYTRDRKFVKFGENSLNLTKFDEK